MEQANSPVCVVTPVIAPHSYATPTTGESMRYPLVEFTSPPPIPVPFPSDRVELPPLPPLPHPFKAHKDPNNTKLKLFTLSILHLEIDLIDDCKIHINKNIVSE